MASGFEESTANGGGVNDAGDFECNICFELAQDPIVTLCGHLFCWPCLYRWLHHHSQSQECPVCKALIQEDKLVPLYGRGKSSSDPRSRPPLSDDDHIPNRPSGQRPETAPPPPPPGSDHNYFSGFGSGFLGGFMPLATARFGNMTMSAGFGGLFPSLLSFQFGFPDTTMYGAAHGSPYGYSQTVRGAHGHGLHHGHGLGQGYHPNHRVPASQGQDSVLKHILFLIGFLVLLTLFWS